MAKNKEPQKELLTKEDRVFLVACLNAVQVQGAAAEVSQILARIAALQAKLREQ